MIKIRNMNFSHLKRFMTMLCGQILKPCVIFFRNADSLAQEIPNVKDTESNVHPMLVSHVLRVKKPCGDNPVKNMALDDKSSRAKRYAFEDGLEESDQLPPWNAVFPRRGSRNDALRHALRIKRVNDMFSKHALRVRKAPSSALGYALRVRRGDAMETKVEPEYFDFIEPGFRGQSMGLDLLRST